MAKGKSRKQKSSGRLESGQVEALNKFCAKHGIDIPADDDFDLFRFLLSLSEKTLSVVPTALSIEREVGKLKQKFGNDTDKVGGSPCGGSLVYLAMKDDPYTGESLIADDDEEEEDEDEIDDEDEEDLDDEEEEDDEEDEDDDEEEDEDDSDDEDEEDDDGDTDDEDEDEEDDDDDDEEDDDEESDDDDDEDEEDDEDDDEEDSDDEDDELEDDDDEEDDEDDEDEEDEDDDEEEEDDEDDDEEDEDLDDEDDDAPMAKAKKSAKKAKRGRGRPKSPKPDKETQAKTAKDKLERKKAIFKKMKSYQSNTDRLDKVPYRDLLTVASFCEIKSPLKLGGHAGILKAVKKKIKKVDLKKAKAKIK